MKRLPVRSLAQSAILTIAVTLTILFVSPLTLALLDQFLVLDWVQLSNVGQSYTGVSALLSAGALIAVAVTVRLQTQQAALVQQQTTKNMQFELLRLVLSQPELYGPIVGSSAYLDDSEKYRQHLFATMWTRYASFSYETGEIGEVTLRNEHFANTFASEEGRRWYRISFPYWTQAADRNPRMSRFVSIMREEYDKAVSNASAPDVTTLDTPNPEGTQESGPDS